ncbi:MAG: phosphate acyltransferase PlsX [Calditrichaeota bacterium]|nr:MAG: phosphate acyltransferase PlsX [Calditrichota bacterium]
MANCTIILDAMGGDHAPDVIVYGARQALARRRDLKLIFVGDSNRLKPLLEKAELSPANYKIVHTDQVVSMDEVPRAALQYKPRASVLLAAELLARDQGDVMLSAGNTGATILACSQKIERLPGVERSALAAVLPSMRQRPQDPGKTMMLDVGATLHCTSNQLVSFAIMGTHYFREVLGFTQPRVGLLNIGEEDTKGHQILVETNARLRRLGGIQFVGNVEGKDIMRGLAEVVVTEGYVGNIVLKSMEGLAENAIEMIRKIWQHSVFYKLGLLLLSPAIKRIKRRVDYTEYGGAPILGFKKLIFKAHGRSNEKAIGNAILVSASAVEHDLVGKISQAVEESLLPLTK